MPRLFTITTDRLRLVWSGEPKPLAVPAPAGRRPFGLRVARLDGGERPRVRVNRSATVLPEETAYTLFVRSRDGSRVEVQHADPVLVGRLQQPAPDTIHGPLRFGSQVGQSFFVVLLGGVPHLRFSVEIVPSKLDYRRDYRALVAEVMTLADDLAVQHVAATSQTGRILPERGSARTEVALLDALADDLDRALHRAFRQPLRALVRTEQPVPAHRVKRPDAALVRHLAHRPPPSTTVAARAATWSLDTPEHRWLAVQLQTLGARLAQRLAWPVRTERDAATHALIEQLHRRVERWLSLPPLAALPPGLALPDETLRLARTPGYREAARAIRLLRQRFSLAPEGLPFRLRDLHRLYEYACFLWIVRALAGATGQPVPAEALLEPDANGLDLRLRTGRHRLSFPTPDGGRVVVRYVPRLAAPGALLPQRPDFLLTRLTPGQPPRRYVLDAKYRLDASPAAVTRFGHPAPPARALGVLHRYRDAIVERGTEAPLRRVVQAAVLFPWRDDGRYEAGRLARSLDTLGIGAIPVLPGATHWLATWIQGIVSP